MTVLLETARLRLRSFAPTDADDLFDLDADPEVMRFLTGGAPTPRRVIEEEILPRFLRRDERFPGFGFWAAMERSSGEFVGWFSLRPTDEASVRELELGYRLRRAVWGRGYATEGARALLGIAFAGPAVGRVVATTYEDNLASRRVLEKLGFALVRRFRATADDLARAGTYDASAAELWDGDDVEYALTRA
jgi:RimJ/RimL family protein N-acetyltransferase